VLDACDSRDPATQSRACPGRLNTADTFQVTGDAGDYYVWLAANNSEVELVRTTLRVREIDPGPGETCQTAIPIAPGVATPITPGSTERFFVPSCAPATGGLTWYRFTASRELSLITLHGAGALALVDAASGAELGCLDDGTLLLPQRGAPGRELCFAVPSGSGVTGVTIRQLDWNGVDGMPTDLMIERPLGDTGSPLSITSESFLAVTPTQIYMGINANSTTTAGIVTAPRAGGTTADRILIDRFTFGNAAVTIGEALFSAEEQASRANRLHRLVDSTGSLSPSAWDTGSAYASPAINALGLVEPSNTFLMANRGTATVPTSFYSASGTAPGAVTLLGQNAALRDVVAIDGDGTWIYVIGATVPGPGTTVVRTVYRLPASDVTATPQPMVSEALVGFGTTQGAMVLDATRDILYFRSTDVPRGVHAIFDASTADPVYVGPVFVRGGSGDQGLALDPSIPALYLFETESVSTGAFIELR
jgi:hypothetical protein